MTQARAGTNFFLFSLSALLVGIPVTLVLIADEQRLDQRIPENWRDAAVLGLTLAWFWGALKIMGKVRKILEARDARAE